ncbi:MAG: hypothetical protein VXZ67_05910, partial [Pseudomonadota bacterium]|nr:hypothetical protein [Pseudomonadota bacterium]
SSAMDFSCYSALATKPDVISQPCMQRDDHPILVESRAHISRNTAGEIEDAITADKVGVILDHSLAHTS